MSEIKAENSPVPLNYAVVWLSHAEADVVHLNQNASESHSLYFSAKGPASQARKQAAALTVPDVPTYFSGIADALAATREIVITGLEHERQALSKYLEAQYPEVAAKVVGIETLDHPSGAELLACARKYFMKADISR